MDFVCVSLSSSVKFISFSKFNFNFSIMDDPLLLSERTGSPLKTPALFTFSPRSSAALDATYVRGSRILSRQNYIYITSYSHTLTTHTYITLEPQAKNENAHANDRKSTSFFFPFGEAHTFIFTQPIMYRSSCPHTTSPQRFSVRVFSLYLSRFERAESCTVR